MAVAAAAGEGDDGGKSSSAGFRCLDAARYVAAAVVIVLIAAVVVNAIKVVSRPDDITVLVVGNSVVTAKVPDPPEKKDTLFFQFTLRAVNPGGRVRIYFSGIKVYIFEKSTLASTLTPDLNCSIRFHTPDITLPPTKYVDNTKTASVSDDPNIVVPSFFDALYRRGGRVSGATVRVDGSVIAETSLGVNTSARHITLYCRGIAVGPEDKDFMSTQETPCTKS